MGSGCSVGGAMGSGCSVGIFEHVCLGRRPLERVRSISQALQEE